MTTVAPSRTESAGDGEILRSALKNKSPARDRIDPPRVHGRVPLINQSENEAKMLSGE